MPGKAEPNAVPEDAWPVERVPADHAAAQYAVAPGGRCRQGIPLMGRYGVQHLRPQVVFLQEMICRCQDVKKI